MVSFLVKDCFNDIMKNTLILILNTMSLVKGSILNAFNLNSVAGK